MKGAHLFSAPKGRTAQAAGATGKWLCAPNQKYGQCRGSEAVPGHRAKRSLEEMFEGLVEDEGLMRVESWGPLSKGF